MSEQTENWNMIGFQTEEGPRVYRIRDRAPTGVTEEAFGNCVVVEWRFARSGLPDKDLQHKQSAFETLLDSLDDNPNSLLVHVYTGNGAKEWCYYARDYPKFMEELNILLADQPRFPISIEHMVDPVWKYRKGIKDHAEAATSAHQSGAATPEPAKPWWKKLFGG